MSSDVAPQPLGDYVTLLSGSTPSKANPDYWGGSTPWVSAKDMGNFWISDSEDHLTPAGVAAASRLVPAGTVLLLTRGMTLHKRVPICCVASPSTFNQDVKAVIPKNGLSARFLPYLLTGNHDRLHAKVDSAGHGTGRLNTEAVLSFPVRIPTWGEQEGIADIGEAIDERITLLRETNATVEAIAQALFKSWFVDFDPVRARMEGRAPDGMDEATAALFPDGFEDSALGLVPKGWRVGTLAELSDLNPESWSARSHPDRIAYVDLANTKDNEIDSVADFAFDDAPSRARRVLRSGDTIMGTVRPGNRSFAFIHEPACNLTASTGFAVLRPSAEENTEFVYLAATQESSIEYLAHVADGGAYPAVRPDVVSGLQSVVPEAVVLKAFHAVAAPLLAKVSENQQQAQTLATLRDTLLPRLISGQLRLPEAHQEMDGALP